MSDGGGSVVVAVAVVAGATGRSRPAVFSFMAKFDFEVGGL
jgi:hypothetical protein